MPIMCVRCISLEVDAIVQYNQSRSIYSIVNTNSLVPFFRRNWWTIM